MQGLFRVVAVSDIHVSSGRIYRSQAHAPWSTLRSNFQSLLEDDKIMTLCTRKDLRALFNLLKDAFNEFGELRMTLNDAILNLSLAPKISEAGKGYSWMDSLNRKTFPGRRGETYLKLRVTQIEQSGRRHHDTDRYQASHRS